MVDKNKVIEITNRSRGSIGYSVENYGTRTLAAGETISIPMEELRRLAFQPGGMRLIEETIIIRDAEALEEILGEVEPEYVYEEEQTKNLLLYGTLDQLKDALDFAPEGVIELIQKLAVELRLNDLAKRKAILDATGFNVNTAISINEMSNEDSAEEEVKTRRTNATVEVPSTETKTRRTTSRYNIVG